MPICISFVGGYKPYFAQGQPKGGDWKYKMEKPSRINKKDEEDSFGSVGLIKDLSA